MKGENASLQEQLVTDSKKNAAMVAKLQAQLKEKGATAKRKVWKSRS